MSRKFRNDYCQLQLASRKYFRKTAGSSNNAEALSVLGRCRKRRVWPAEYEQTAFPRSTSSAGRRLVGQWIQLNDIAQHSSNSRSFVHGQHRAELIPLVHESLGSRQRIFSGTIEPFMYVLLIRAIRSCRVKTPRQGQGWAKKLTFIFVRD